MPDEIIQPEAVEPEHVESEPEPEAVEPVPPAPEGESESPAIAKLHREAARYRTQLRDAEAERDKLAERVAKLQMAEAERIAGLTMTAPGDLWALTKLADFLTEDGELDADAVSNTVAKLVHERPTWKRQGMDFGGGVRGDGNLFPVDKPSFAGMLRKR